ncbi:MAG: type II toxin-antitoxin system VapC family toxin [Acidobacteria bacterium]|nr:type II toxin-antitoxin system VapC family toxin [Acidobacteriota bacterium]MCY3963985.1 type II toxin-antitoxin system VapC family toxin [Acidobacteriota bacterium]MCY3969346.1 type II toxin-antitoxin system VapC family toxin [Acidobacteriota bacterium]
MCRHGLLDTSVVIDLDLIEDASLPEQSTVSAITLAELTVGPLAAGRDEEERARRQDRLQWAAATWDPLPFDALAARAYGRIYSALVARGRVGRRRFADLLIAATALANDLPLYTRNAADVKGLDDLITVRSV